MSFFIGVAIGAFASYKFGPAVSAKIAALRARFGK